MEEQTVSRKKQVIAALAVLIIIVVIVGVVTATSKKKNIGTSSNTAATSSQSTINTSAATATSNTTGDTTTTNTSTTNTSGYSDGSYSAEGEYDSPGGNEVITIKVTLKDGIITDTSATSGATDGEAQEYQSEFISGYKSFVVGKSIDKVSLSRVSGSSLTSQGFNDAITQIKSDAKTS